MRIQKEIIRIITSIEKHPGLFMPEGRSFTALNRILYGTIIGRMNTQWYEIYMEITNEFQKRGTSHLEDVTQRTYYEWDLNDEEMFDLWFECFYEIIEKYKECKE